MALGVLVSRVTHDLPGEWEQLVAARQQSRHVLANLCRSLVDGHLGGEERLVTHQHGLADSNPLS